MSPCDHPKDVCISTTYTNSISAALVDLSMASALTYFVSNLKQVESLSIRLDSHSLSELVTRDFLTDCQTPTLTRLRLEVAWIWDNSSGCPLLDFVKRNKQIQHFHFAYVDLDQDRWPTLLEALWTECGNLQSAESWYISESASAVLFNGEEWICIKATQDIGVSLSEAQRGLSILSRDPDVRPASRYDRYSDDSDYDSSEGV